jgi:choline dehydrogenase
MYRCTDDQPSPNEGQLSTNATFVAEATEQFKQRPAAGPYTLAMGNSAIYVPLQNITEKAAALVAKMRAQIADGSALSYLPASASGVVKTGYLAQLEVLAQAFENPEQPIMESPFTAAPGIAFLLRPLSRGTVLLNPSNHDATPIVDYRTASNPLDLEIMVEFIRYMRRIYETRTFRDLNAVEVAPGASVTSDEGLIAYLRTNVIGSFMHPCCTAAMMPEEKGGVVSSSLRVHGVRGLRVADVSVVPLLPGTHTTTTAYAIGEKVSLEYSLFFFFFFFRVIFSFFLGGFC